MEEPNVKHPGKIKGYEKSNPGQVPGPVNIIYYFGVFFNQNFNKGHDRTEIKIMHELPEPAFAGWVMQIEDHTK